MSSFSTFGTLKDSEKYFKQSIGTGAVSQLYNYLHAVSDIHFQCEQN